ncbi:Gfo/Idh/MocA family protein [Patescibacteria group bacterium]
MKEDNKKYKVGIIGCGTIFKRHLEAIRENSDSYALVSVCDTNEERLHHLSKEHDVSGYLDYKDMLAKEKEMNTVVIATPNSLHFEQAIESLNSGKDVFIEKPIDFSAERVAKIQNTADQLGKNAYSILQVRYNPTISLVRHALEKEFLGDIRSVSLVQRWQRPLDYFETWRGDIKVGGRTLYEVGIHYMDIMQLLFGPPSVHTTKTFNNKHMSIDFEDTVFSILEFPSGSSGSLEVTVAAEPHNLECSISALGSEGFIKIGGKALDKIEDIKLFSKAAIKEFSNLQKTAVNSIEPNSYGVYAGSCPNHPTLYREVAAGRGITVGDSINVVRFIEDVYDKHV